jgi:acyl dehydratase
MAVGLSHTRMLLRFEDIQIGQTISVSECIDDGLHTRFTELSGDYGLLHTNKSHAARFGYDERLGYGFLLTTLLSRMVGTFLESAICVSVSIDFTAPVLVGDEIELRGTAAQIQSATRSVIFRTEFRRRAELLARGKLMTRFLES